MEITETNKLIAEFMGLETHISMDTGYVCVKRNYSDNYWVSTHYNSSWDWLMPVVKKINDESINIGLSPYRSILRFAIMNVDIKRVYRYCVKFIKWWCIHNRIACYLADYPQSEAMYDSITEYRKHNEK